MARTALEKDGAGDVLVIANDAPTLKGRQDFAAVPFRSVAFDDFQDDRVIAAAAFAKASAPRCEDSISSLRRPQPRKELPPWQSR